MCIFCEIIAGNIPSRKVYEDEHVLAILDVNPLSAGHTLIMPKKHVDSFTEADTETIHQCIDVAHLLAVKITERLEAPGYNLLSNTGAVSGQSIDHLHFHIVPRYGKEKAISFGEPDTSLDLDALLAKING